MTIFVDCTDDTDNPPPELRVRIAIAHLRAARDELKAAGAIKTLARVRLALTSAQGAQRHADRSDIRAQRRAGR